MEENKKEELEQTNGTPEGEAGSDRWYNTMTDRNCMLFGIAGIYLIYTGIRLCKNVLDGVEGGGIGFMIAGIVFVIIGAGMGILGARGALRNDSLKKAKQAAEERMKAFEEPAKDSMSLKDRASLVNRVSEEENAEENVPTEEVAEDATSEEEPSEPNS